MKMETVMRYVLVLMLLLLSGCNDNTVTHGIDKDTGLPYWQVNDGKISLRLIQRTPLQTQAFFLGRGFNRQQTETIAHSCVFQSIFKNISNKTSTPLVLSYDLDQWSVRYHDKSHHLKTRDAWKQYWQKQGVAVPQQLAFNWSLLPTHQEYQPGDYNWGMTAYDMPPGSEFDLTVHWREAGEARQARIANMRCPTNIAESTQGEKK